MPVKFNPFTSTFDFVSDVSGFASNSFVIMQTPNGTSPTADNSADTLTFASANSTITITGNATTDTIDLVARPASATDSGIVTTGTQTFAGAKTFSGTIGASNLSGTNTGDQPIGGSNTHVQYNNSGAFGGDSNFTWDSASKKLTLSALALGATTQSSELFQNTTAATTGSRVQVSPSIQWSGKGWKTSAGGASQSVDFRAFGVPIEGTTTPSGQWKLQYSINGGAYSEGLQYFTTVIDSSAFPKLKVNGFGEFNQNNSSTIDTLQNLNIVNPTGSRIHQAFTFGSTIKGGITVHNDGYTLFNAAGSGATFNFNLGSTITSTNLIAQIYSSGIYSSYNGLFGQKLTAGSADTTALSTLNTYGSFATKGILVTASTYTLAATETMVYVDPSTANLCSGTPNACSTYTNSTDCGNHSGAGCSWFSGTACSTYNGTDETTCESGHIGCTWDLVSCSGANNTDQTTCETQDDVYGGNCTWDTSTCPSFSDQGTCQAQTGCTWNFSDCHAFDAMSQSACETGHSGCTWVGGDCHAFDATDQTTCETGHTGCTWDGSLCNGTYDEASVCNGQYDTSCTGNLCNGDFNNGNCSGTWGTECQGTASCTGFVTSGSCAAESGCTWTTGVLLTLPTSSSSNKGNTSRIYSIVNIGATGTVTIQANSGDTILQYSTIPLYKKGDRVLLHHHNVISSCDTFVSEGTCTANSGCTWNTSDCHAFDGTDMSTCETGHSGCSWDGSLCNGTYGGSCSGSYTSSKPWVIHNLEKSKAYVEKTANYTLTDIDDIVNCTSGTFNITLPSAITAAQGREYTIKNTGSGVITLNTSLSQTIDGNASGTLTLTITDSIVVQSTGTNWIIV